MTQSGLATSLRMCTKPLISARILYAERCPNGILPRCEKGFLASWDQQRQRLTIRRTLESAYREVLHLHASLLRDLTVPNVRNDRDATKTPERSSDGFPDGSAAQYGQPSNENTQKPHDSDSFGQLGRSDAGGDIDVGGNNSSIVDFEDGIL